MVVTRDQSPRSSRLCLLGAALVDCTESGGQYRHRRRLFGSTEKTDMAPEIKDIAVIGAGVIGLSTAYNILDTIDDVRVTVFYEAASPNTTSDAAAGVWLPHNWLDTPIEKVLGWGKTTWDHLVALARSEAAPEAGAFLVSGAMLFRREREDPPWKDVVIGYRKLTARELDPYGGRYRDGFFFSTVACACSRYLPWLAGRLKARGGRMRRRTVSGLGELADFDVVVNCAGSGARELCRDPDVRPTSGHVIRAKAPWIKQFVVAPEDELHVLCSPDGVVLGMTHREQGDDPEARRSDRERILAGCARLVPSVARATELRDSFGFRPVRRVVRLEIEEVELPAGKMRVVHNYGHGSSGITLHWGCAKEAASLVRRLIHLDHNAKL